MILLFRMELQRIPDQTKSVDIFFEVLAGFSLTIWELAPIMFLQMCKLQEIVTCKTCSKCKDVFVIARSWMLRGVRINIVSKQVGQISVVRDCIRRWNAA